MYQTCNQYQVLKYDSTVKEIQSKLNRIRDINHISVPGWDILATDGLLGPKTKRALTSYQKYYDLPDKSGQLTNYTIDNINFRYSHLVSLKYCIITAPDPKHEIYLSVEADSSYGFMDFIDNLEEFISGTIEKMDEMLKEISKVKLTNDRTDADKFLEKFKDITRNEDIKKLRAKVERIWENKEIAESLSQEIDNNQVHNARTWQEDMKIRETQRKISHTKTQINIDSNDVRNTQKKLTEEISSVKILNKIKLKFNPDTIRSIAPKVKIISIFYGLKDLIWDIIWNSWHMDSEEFWLKFKQDLYKFIDDFLIGVLAEALISAAIAALGIAATSGTAIVVSVLGCILVGCAIGFLFDKSNISFCEFFELAVRKSWDGITSLMNRPATAQLIA